MKSEKILERIKNVYKRSIKFDISDNKAEENIQVNKDSYVIEIDGNYLLFFNDIYRNTVRKWLKNLLKKITWPVLKRQIYFNTAIRQVLYDIVQKNYETSTKFRENSTKIAEIDQKIEQISTELTSTKKSFLDVSQLLYKQVSKINVASTKSQETSTKIAEIEHKIAQISTELTLTKKSFSSEELKMASGLWFNDPLIVGYRDNGEAYWQGTNERIFEKAFVLQSLAQLYESTEVSILDVGAAESLLSYELATLNYSVTAIDIRPIAVSHPNLKFVKSDICKPVLPPNSFDCVIALSTLEHIGLGWYGDEVAENYDVEAVKEINGLLKSEGYFILTVPYGKKALTPVHRIYDQKSLQRLIDGFDVIKIAYGVRKDDFTWNITDNVIEASDKEHHPNNYLPGAVAMLVCKKQSA